MRIFKGHSRQVWSTWVENKKCARHLLTLTIAFSKLGLGYVDLFLIHSPDLVKGKLESVWRTFEELRDVGLTKRVMHVLFSISLLNARQEHWCQQFQYQRT